MGLLIMPCERPIVTGPWRPELELTTTENTALPLAWVQVHSLNLGAPPPAAVFAVTEIEAGQGAEPVFAIGFSAVQPGKVSTTLVPSQPELLVYVTFAPVELPACGDRSATERSVGWLLTVAAPAGPAARINPAHAADAERTTER